jgi:hypothetical protein
MLGQIDPTTGKQVYVINWHPRFHDISYVLIPADKIAVSLLKVASFGGNPLQRLVSSAFLAEKFAANMLASKTAEIQKQIPAAEAPGSTESLEDLIDFIPEMKAQEPKLPTPVLDQLAQYPLATSMSSMASLGILPKPQEFQRIFLIKMNQKPLADELDRHNVCFHPDMMPEPEARHENAMRLHYSNFEPNILNLLKSFLPERSCAAPHMANRVIIMVKQANKMQEDLPIFVKTAEEIKALPFISKSKDSERKAVGVLPMLLAAAGLYSVFGKSAPDVAVSGVGSLIQKHPGLAAALGVGLASTFGALIEPKKSGNYSRAAYVNPDKSDPHAYINSMKQAPILKISSDLGLRSSAAMKRLFVGIPAAYLASGVLQKHKEINPNYSEGSLKGMVRRNPDLISGALIADSMLALKGKGSYGLTKTITPKLKSLLNSMDNSNLTKQASFEALSEVGKGMIFPIAMGGASMPSRIAGGLIDTAVINAASYLSNRKKDRESFKK